MFNYARENDDKDQSFSRRAASQLPPCYIGAPPLDAALPGRHRERENGGAISVQPHAACGACLPTPALTHVPRPHPCAAPQTVQPPYARGARRPHARVAPVSSSSPLTHRPLISDDEARLHTASPFPASRTLPRELCPFRAACSHRAGRHPRIKHARDGPPPTSALARNVCVSPSDRPRLTRPPCPTESSLRSTLITWVRTGGRCCRRTCGITGKGS